MDYLYGLVVKLRGIGKWFTSSNENKRKREGPPVNENLYPKRLKLVHTASQSDASFGRENRFFTSRSEKIQSLANKSDKTYAGSEYYLATRPPSSWNLSMKENSLEFSSDDECIDVGDNDVQIISEKCSRQPLTSTLLNNMENNSQDGIEVLKIVQKNRTPRPSSVHAQGGSLQGSVSTSSSGAVKKLGRFSMQQTIRRDLSTVCGGSGGGGRLLRSSQSGSESRLGTAGKRHTTLNMEVQMVDKAKYGALLKSVLCSNISTSTPSSSFASLQDLEKNLQETCISSPRRRSALETPKKKIDVIDLTKPRGSRRPTRLEVKPASGSKPDNDSDSDVELVSVTPVTVPRVNSYQEQVKDNQFIMPEWLQTLREHYQSIEKETTEKANEQQIKKNLYAKQNEKALATVEERVRRHMTITESVILDEEPEEPEPELPELTPDILKRITSALAPHPSNEVVTEGFALRITRKDMQTLAKLNWLNDEVINFYMNLLIDRGKKEGMPKVYAFNTFFYPKLLGSGHASLKRWTRKVDVFSHDLLVVPVHLGVHWCMATIDFRTKIVEYYDSMGHANNKCLAALLKYLEDESLDKKGQPYDTSNWKTINKKDIPQQMNGSDCGMFACTFAEYKCRNAKITFGQDDMPYFRKKMVYEILTGKLMIKG